MPLIFKTAALIVVTIFFVSLARDLLVDLSETVEIDTQNFSEIGGSIIVPSDTK